MKEFIEKLQNETYKLLFLMQQDRVGLTEQEGMVQTRTSSGLVSSSR
jgi:hypothetical protein